MNLTSISSFPSPLTRSKPCEGGAFIVTVLVRGVAFKTNIVTVSQATPILLVRGVACKTNIVTVSQATPILLVRGVACETDIVMVSQATPIPPVKGVACKTNIVIMVSQATSHHRTHGFPKCGYDDKPHPSLWQRVWLERPCIVISALLD